MGGFSGMCGPMVHVEAIVAIVALFIPRKGK